MIPIRWTVSSDSPFSEQVENDIDRKIQTALSKIREEVNSPVPKDYRHSLETKTNQRLKGHQSFLQGIQDRFGFTEKEYDGFQSWYRISIKVGEAQKAFEAYINEKLKIIHSIPELISRNEKPKVHLLIHLLNLHFKSLRQYYMLAKFALLSSSFLLEKKTIENFFKIYAQIKQNQQQIFEQLSLMDQDDIDADMGFFIRQAHEPLADLLIVFNDYLNSLVGKELENFQSFLYHSILDSNFNKKLRLLMDMESSEALEKIKENEEAIRILDEFSYKFSKLQNVEACVKQAEILAARIVSGGPIEDHEKLSPADAKLLKSLMNFKKTLELLKKAGISIPEVFFYLELIDRFKKVLQKVPSPDLSKGTLFAYHGRTFDEYHYNKNTLLSSLMSIVTKGPATHAGIIASEPGLGRKRLYLSHILGNYIFEEYTEPFLAPYLVVYHVDLKNLVQEKVLPIVKEILGENWEMELETLWTQSKYEVEMATELPDVKNGFLHRVTSIFKSSSKLLGFDQSSIESIEDRGQTQMFCSEYARLSLIAASNVFEKKLRKKLLEIAQKPELKSQKEFIEKTPYLIYHLAHEKSRIASSTPAGLVNKYTRDSKNNPNFAKSRKAILVPMDQIETEVWAAWGKLFRLPRSRSLE